MNITEQEKQDTRTMILYILTAFAAIFILAVIANYINLKYFFK